MKDRLEPFIRTLELAEHEQDRALEKLIESTRELQKLVEEKKHATENGSVCDSRPFRHGSGWDDCF